MGVRCVGLLALIALLAHSSSAQTIRTINGSIVMTVGDGACIHGSVVPQGLLMCGLTRSHAHAYVRQLGRGCSGSLRQRAAVTGPPSITAALSATLLTTTFISRIIL